MGRILLVSDSMGTSIHARGIFNFTYSLVEMMKALGHSVSLLVEAPVAPPFTNTLPLELATPYAGSIRKALLSGIVFHYETDRFRFDWRYPDDAFERLAANSRPLANAFLTVQDSREHSRNLSIAVEKDELSEFQPGDYSYHLKLFDEFVVCREVYSESFRRGGHNLKPLTVNAEDFDYVFIDTPHYCDFSGIGKSKIVYVVHDFIPIYDMKMWHVWRNLFARKLECTVREGSRVIFNSVATENDFLRIYSKDVFETSAVVYPPLRKVLAAASAQIDRKRPSFYMTDIIPNKIAEQSVWQDNMDKRAKLGDKSHFGNRAPKWQPDLPFFVSLLSDEPRKNVAALVEASTRLVGRANVVIAGQIDGNRYMRQKPEDFPNLHFAGYISELQKYDLLHSCAGFVFPSLSEGFGIPIVEAAAFGAPVVCTDLPVFREITLDKGYYFDPSDIGSLVRQMEAILKNKTAALASADQLRRLSRELFSQENMRQRLNAVLS